MNGLAEGLIERFASIVGERHALRPPEDLSHYNLENRGIVTGNTPLVLLPGSTEEVAGIVRLAAETGTAIVPQGGHTGHAAGGVPSEHANEIVVALGRMNRIRDIDLLGSTMTVDAGVVLEKIQEAADAHDRLFPLALGSQGSCQIGGNISTNAGGTGVLAYGNTRALVLGIEAVLPSGEIWHGLRRLKKDNTGYDLRDLFIGAEGTLGIVTGAVLKLFPKPRGREVAFAGLASPEAALGFLNAALEMAGNQVTAFELIPRIGIEFLNRHFPRHGEPLASTHAWHVLFELSSGRSQEDARQLTEAIFERAIGDGLIEDAALAGSIAQQRNFWGMRENLPHSQRPEGASIAHDISVPVHRVPELIRRGEKAVRAIVPGARMVAFGHLGDGNIHFNFSQPTDMDRETWLGYRKAVNEAVYDLVIELDGSISAEHGIGKLKRDLLARVKSPVEMAMMRAIKKAIDPKGIMNPGKVL